MTKGEVISLSFLSKTTKAVFPLIKMRGRFMTTA